LAQAATAAGAGVPVVGVLAYLASITVILALFDLVPAFPLDGGRVLRAVLWCWKGDLRWATRAASWVGGAFAVALIAFGVCRCPPRQLPTWITEKRSRPSRVMTKSSRSPISWFWSLINDGVACELAGATGRLPSACTEPGPGLPGQGRTPA
jgi:Zn-dependent protease